MVDGNLLTRRTLIETVAIASGRADLPDWNNFPPDFESTVKHISREDARKQGCLILVAEDNEYNQKVIAQQLMLLGRAADITGNGQEALRRWYTGSYSILITDLHMPVMDGYELTTAIRAAEQGGPRMPIIAFTANALKGEAERCKAVGMDDYLSKPVQLVQLKEMLNKWQPVVLSDAFLSQSQPAVDVRVLAALIGNDEAVIGEFLNDFRVSAMQIAAELRTACLAGDALPTAAAAHKLKSAARSVGAMALGDFCAAMEKTGRLGDGPALWGLLPGFEVELARVESFLVTY
jgi:CheY-like chemotaxis protein